MKDHEKRELVNRLTKLARDFAETEQLRSRIAGEVLPALEAAEAAEAKERKARQEAQRRMADLQERINTATRDQALAVAKERKRWADELRAMPNGCALADNRAHVERFRSMALARLLEGPNCQFSGTQRRRDGGD